MRKLYLLAVCLIGSVTLSAQTPGQNVNMVTGTKFPGGDPYLQKQNEPSLAISTRNACRLLGGANDYRAVNLPGLPGDKEIGDAWVGFYTSIDCGQTWYSTLVPGYLQDQTAIGKASPVYGLTAAADPTVRAGAGGFFVYSFIAFNRGSNVGKLALARFIDRNTKEAITKAENAITYIDTKVWDTGSAGQFIDKPTVVITPGVGTCTVGGNVVPASVVHMAWTVFVGNDINIRTKVYYARSSNCGATLDFPATKLSEGYAVNQGASIGVAANGNIFLVWRQISTPKGDPNNILIAKSVDGGKSFTKPSPVPLTPAFVPFDQGTTSKTFRTTAFPAAAVDRFGRLYVAAAVRGFANLNQSRIVVTSTTDGVIWTMPQAVENLPASPGHQIQPAITAVGGKLNLVWLDFRDDVSDEYHDFIQEIFPIRHTMDVRGGQSPLNSNGTLQWTTYGILQTESPAATAPRISRYLTGNYGNTPGAKQLQFNRPNLKLYAGGTRPFVGDYIDVAGLAAIGQHASPQTWLPNDGTGLSSTLTAAQTFYAAWTDNRDAKIGSALPEPPGDDDEGATVAYMAPGPTCTGTNPPTTTRNANVYEARISPGVFVAAPANSKASIRSGASGDARVQRAFPVLVHNNTGQKRRFQLHIDNQPSDRAAGTGGASFVQFPYRLPLTQPPVFATPLVVTDTIFADIPPKSSITRTVYVLSTEKYPQIKVSVNEQNAPSGAAPLSGATLLNPDVENPDVENPDVENPDVENQGVANAEIHNPDVENPDVENPDVENPDVENPDVENPDVENPDVENPDVENPDVENPDVENPDVENPDVENPDVENPDVENAALTDFSVDVSNDGNTTGTYQVKFAVGGNTSGYVYQVIGRRVYKTPTANGCQLAEKADNQILFNITDPDLSAGPPPDANDGSVSNATAVLKPGEKIKVTLRAFDKDYFKVINPLKAGGSDGIVKPFCAIVSTKTGGVNCPVATNPVDVIVRAGSANTGETTPRTDVEVINPEGDLAIATASLPNGSTGVPYAGNGLTLQATGGLGSSLYQWNATTPLPAGLALSSAGVLSGTPTSVGTFNVGVRVTDGVQSVTKTLTLVIIAPTVTLSFETNGQPTAAAVDEALFPPLKVKAVDANSNPVPNVPVTLSVAQGIASALYGDTIVTTDQSGVATFKNTRLSSEAPNGYQLRASAPGASNATSQSFGISPIVKTIADPAGDQTQTPGVTNPDLISAFAMRNANAATFTVGFATGTFNAATTWATIYLDLDHNIATGSPGVTSACTLDASTIGADYFIAVGAQFTPAQVYRVTYPPCASWTFLGTVPVTLVGSGYQVTVPLTMLGNDEGGLNFKVATSRLLDPGGTSSTGLLDQMPDTGIAAALLDNSRIVAAMSTRDSAPGTGVGIGGSPSNQKLAQVFRTTYGGTLREVRVPVSACGAALDLEIQGVNGNGVPDGNVLVSQSFPAALDSPPAGVFKRLVLANPLAVTPGTRYAFVLKSAGNCNIDHGPVGNLYADGDGFYDVPENLGWVTLDFGDGGRADLPFQVVVDPQVVVIGRATMDPLQVSPSFNETGVAEVTVTSEDTPSMWMRPR
jgi:hypothetical protein